MHSNPFDNSAQSKREKTKTLIIAIQALALVASLAYLFFSQKKANQDIEKKSGQISSLLVEKSELQGNFDASLVKLDSFSRLNDSLNIQLSKDNEAITSYKSKIRSILNKSNATEAELKEARNLISSLNNKIAGMEQEISRLTSENASLLAENTSLNTDKENLTRDLEQSNINNHQLKEELIVASTLNASNISIIPVNVRKNGKEVTSSKANKVDKFLVRFGVSNRVIKSGNTDIYVVVVGPNGSIITNGETGIFNTREEGAKQFTAKLSVQLEPAKKQNVEFSFVPTNFQEGNYKVQVFHNGFSIGEGNQTLKKGGLF